MDAEPGRQRQLATDRMDEEDIGVEDEHIELEHLQARIAELPNQELATLPKVQFLVAIKVKTSTICNNILVFTEIVEYKLIGALKDGYDASKEGVKTSSFNLVQ